MAEKNNTKAPLTPARRLKLSLLSGFLFVIILGAIFWSQATTIKSALLPTPTPVQHAQIATNSFSYQGKNGVDALTLLKQQTTVVQDNSGLVTSIHNRKADNAKHEYWSFFVNGKMAEVGPASYTTKDSDHIEWKIQTY